MNEKYVECMVCGFKGKMLNRHLAKHGMTAVEYHEKFPNSKLALDEIYKSQAEKVSGPRKPPRELVCRYCGGKFNNREVLWLHEKKEKNVFVCGIEGKDYLVCRLCGLRIENLSFHLSHAHKINVEEYKKQFPNSNIVIERISKAQAEVGRATAIPIREHADATLCDKCNEWYLKRFAAEHLAVCVAAHPSKYELNKDYVKCPECNKAMTRIGGHLMKEHGWDKDRLAIEAGRGLNLMASSVKDKMDEAIDYVAAQKKREQTHLERHGYANPFANPEVQKKIAETSQRRYGASHAMKNEEVFIRQSESAHRGPSELEKFFDEHTCEQCVYIGYGGRFIRTKTGVRKYGRLIKDLNPDFIVLSSNVLESALAAAKEHKKLDRQKHRSRWVVELLGDYYHSKEVIGVEPAEHEKELVAAYKSAGIECLVLWEKDVLHRWESIRPMVDAWVEKAVKDMNENPIFSRATKGGIDRRKGDLVASDSSGRKFKSRKMLEKWMASPVNYWKVGLVEGRDYVVCRECGTRVSKVTEHIRRAHGMTKEQYLAKYPQAQMVSEKMSECVATHRLSA